jgi:hypothetical protein
MSVDLGDQATSLIPSAGFAPEIVRRALFYRSPSTGARQRHERAEPTAAWSGGADSGMSGKSRLRHERAEVWGVSLTAF